MLTDHMVFTPKFRAKILVGAVAKDCAEAIRRTCNNLDVEILGLAVSPDHVHLFVQYPPDLSPSMLAEKVKSNSSRELRQRHSWLVKWCKTGLWAPGCFHGSVGHGFDVVERYIKSQARYQRNNL